MFELQASVESFKVELQITKLISPMILPFPQSRDKTFTSLVYILPFFFSVCRNVRILKVWVMKYVHFCNFLILNLCSKHFCMCHRALSFLCMQQSLSLWFTIIYLTIHCIWPWLLHLTFALFSLFPYLPESKISHKPGESILVFPDWCLTLYPIVSQDHKWYEDIWH